MTLLAGLAGTADMPPGWEGSPRAPRRWQAEALPLVQAAIRAGDQPIVHAVMGSGKSVLIARVCRLALERLPAGAKIVVSTPTVKLVEQLAATIAEGCGADSVCCYYTHARDVHAPIVVVCHPSMRDLAGALGGAPVRLWVADEVHKTESDEVKQAIALMAPAFRVGFTATPFRSEVAETLSLWNSLAYSYSLGDALRDGVLVQWEIVTWDGDGFDAVETDAICVSLVGNHAPAGPGIVSSQSIEDAEQVAEAFTASGIPAEAIHSRLGRKLQRQRLEDLRTGKLRCLVHVSLLAEGVDLPWLRWMCLRRKVKARVRFIQEIGRGLRSEAPADTPPGLAPKTRCVFIDPFDLFGDHALSHPEALGAAIDCSTPDLDDEEEDDFPLLDLPPKGREVPKAVAVDAVGAWARRVVSVLELAGVFSRDPRWGQDAGWRRRRLTDKQRATLGKMAWAKAHFPAEHREAIAAICAHPAPLRQGIASDLISALMGVADAAKPYRAAHKPWPWPGGLDVPRLPDRVIGALARAA